MRQPSLFSPIKQQRYEKSHTSNGFSTFQTTTQLNSKDLGNYRKDVRSNIESKEPFVSHKDKPQNLFSNWTKIESPKKQTKKQISKSKPRLFGGLNYEEIFTEAHQPTKTKVDQLFKKQQGNTSLFDVENSFTSFPKPKFQNTLGSNYKESPQKSKQQLERFKSWDNRLDVQLILQNKSLSNKVSPLGDKPNFYKYINETQQGLFDKQSNFLSARNSRNNIFENPKQLLGTKDNSFTLYNTKPKLFQRSISPQITQKNDKLFNYPQQQNNAYITQFPLTDIVRMASHFSQLSTQEITMIPKGYIQEINNLQDILNRVVKRSNI